MSDPIRSLRFAEREYYDIWDDREVVELQAITNIGTYFCTVSMEDGASKLRSRREAFRQYVLSDCAHPMSRPHEVNIG